MSVSGTWQIFRNNSAIHTTNTASTQVTVDNLTTPISLSVGDYINAHCSNSGGAAHTVTFEVEITKTITGLKGEKGDSGSAPNILKLTNTLTNTVNSTSGITFGAFNTAALINDFGADITVATNSITFNTGGRFRCDFNFFLTSASARTNVLFRWAINGVTQRGRSAHNYIRAASGNNEASSNLSEIFDLNDGDVLTIFCVRLANAGTVTVPAGESIFQIESLS